jgi:hypothetical protein
MRKRIINTTIPAAWGGVQEAINHSGLSRASLYKLLKLADGEVENAMVLGRRLINLKSLNSYLSKLSKEQTAVTHNESVRLSCAEICEG